MFENIGDWLGTSGVRIIGIAAVLYTLNRFGHIIISRAVRRAILGDNFASPADEKKRENTIISILDTTVSVLMWVVGTMLVVKEFGIDIGPLVAGASVVGVALGFGAQSLVKDFVSGLFIILENQYRVGDVVSIAGVSGVVEAITMRETILRDLDGHVHHVPNGLVEVATNMTMDFSRINLDIGVSYSSDMKKVEKIIDEVGVDLMNDEQFGKNVIEAPHFVRVDNFGPNEIVVKIVGDVKPGKQWEIAGEFRKRIKAEFDKNKIEIPFPQVVVHKDK